MAAVGSGISLFKAKAGQAPQRPGTRPPDEQLQVEWSGQNPPEMMSNFNSDRHKPAVQRVVKKPRTRVYFDRDGGLPSMAEFANLRRILEGYARQERCNFTLAWL